MEEAEELSDRIAIMDQGQMIALGSHQELVQIVGESDRVDLSINTESGRVIDSWRATEGVHQISAQDGKLTLLAEDSNVVLPRLFESAARLGTRITSVEIHEPNLEAVFLHLTGRALRA
jgi:ABC-2 type transport system ATP-binding protein